MPTNEIFSSTPSMSSESNIACWQVFHFGQYEKAQTRGESVVSAFLSPDAQEIDAWIANSIIPV